MGKARFDLSVTPDGLITDANCCPEEPLGNSGEQLFAWAVVPT